VPARAWRVAPAGLDFSSVRVMASSCAAASASASSAGPGSQPLIAWQRRHRLQ
jgi:hypothetical protein